MIPTELQQATASSTVEQWAAYLQDLHVRIAHRFRRPEVRERLQRYILGLLGEIRRKRMAGRWRRPSEKLSRGARNAS